MRFGICGYGNLGKAMEKIVLSSKGDTLVAIFSRRKGLESEFGSKIIEYEKAGQFQNEIDVMLMCGGSQEDLLWQSPEMLKYFDIIDTFDTHAKIREHSEKLQEMCEKYHHKAIYSCGWDPGVFSLMRVLLANIFNSKPQTFWGEGVSQGHSEALRNIKGVKDAIQFTVPNQDVLEKVKNDPTFVPDENKKHTRVCHVCLDGTRSKEEIENEIINTENYFKGQNDVEIYFDSEEKISLLKKNMFHKGYVFGGDTNSQMQLFVSMQSNPSFTAKIVFAYAKALPKLLQNAYSALDVPVKYIGELDNFSLL